MASRKKFIESVGATCANWYWSWSFVNHQECFVIFGLWDVHKNGLILEKQWNGRGLNQSLEHIRLVQENGYTLKTFPIKYSQTDNGNPRIKGFDPILTDKLLVSVLGCWYAISDDIDVEEAIAEEVVNPEIFIEGATKNISVNAYERNPKARKECLEIYGYQCFVCHFDFKKTYGDIGLNFIHVHHEIALADIGQEYEVDPINDLKPLCPNCHAIIHRIHPPIKVNDLKKILSS